MIYFLIGLAVHSLWSTGCSILAENLTNENLGDMFSVLAGGPIGMLIWVIFFSKYYFANRENDDDEI